MIKRKWMHFMGIMSVALLLTGCISEQPAKTEVGQTEENDSAFAGEEEIPYLREVLPRSCSRRV